MARVAETTCGALFWCQGSERVPEVAEAKDPLEANVELDLTLGSGSVWFTAKAEESVMVSPNEVLVTIRCSSS